MNIDYEYKKRSKKFPVKLRKKDLYFRSINDIIMSNFTEEKVMKMNTALLPISTLDNDSSFIVKKSNSLIHSKYNLSLIEQRIVLIAISFIDDIESRTVEIPVTTYKTLLKQEHFNYQHFVEVLKKLRENSIVMVTINKKTQELDEGIITGWVDRVYYSKGIIQIKFNEDIWAHLIELKEKYTQYQLSCVLNLNSKYSIRMFEILKSYEYIGYYNIKIDELREILFLGSKYPRFNDLDKNIIEPTVREINQNSDIHIAYTPCKKGRKYELIKFTISKITEDEDNGIPKEVTMARNMSDNELFVSIKTILTLKYKCTFSHIEASWNSCSEYSKNALVSTYLALMADEWKDHSITSPKAFFAEHLKRLSKH